MLKRAVILGAAALLALATAGCSSGVAGSVDPDGGSTISGDAGPPDAGAADAGTADAGADDAGADDAGTPDAGTADAGAADAGAADAGESTAPLTNTSFAPMALSVALPNPERGWAAWTGTDLVGSYDAASVAGAFSQGRRLASCLLSLAAYRTQALPGTYLTDLDAALRRVRAAGMKCVVWFAYDFTAAGNDATATQIAAHLSQLAPVLQANADAIAYVKAGFIGAWGEWHSSQNQNSCGYNSGTTPCSVADANRLLVRDALLGAFHPLDLVQFRYPRDCLQWFPTVLTGADAFGPSSQARVGAHNDCFLAGPTDTGTYSTTAAVQAAQRAYVAALTEYTPYGVETAANCDLPHRTSCADIQAEGARYHLAWFKGPSADIAEWTGAWASGGCATEVGNLMGYRLQLDGLSHQDAAAPGQSVTFQVSLRNVGWARVFSPRRLRVLLVRGATTLVADADADLRALPSQATGSTVQAVHLTVPAGAPLGSYDVFLQVPDTWPTTRGLAAFAVRFANADAAGPGQQWDAAAFRLSTGTRLTVR